MHQPPRPISFCILLRRLPHLFVILSLAACNSDRSGRSQSAATLETPSLPPAMMARAAFFAGKIETEALLGAGVGFGRGRGGRRGFFGRGGNDNEIMDERQVWRDSSVIDFQEIAYEPVLPAPGSNLPAVQLRLRLTNRGPDPAEVEIVDFNSALGNFAVQPPKLMLAAGESREVEPMTSRLGVTADEIPLIIRLRTGGKAEQQVLKLQLVKTPPTPPKPPAQPAATP